TQAHGTKAELPDLFNRVRGHQPQRADFDSESALREEPGGHEQEERQPGAEQADPELRGTRWLPLTKADPQPSHHRREHDHHDRLYGLEPGRWNNVAEHVEIRKE